MTATSTRLLAIIVASLLAFTACGNDETSSDPTVATTEHVDVNRQTGATGQTAETGGAAETVDPAAFVDGALTAEPVATDCTLTDGTETSCYELTVAGFPANRDTIGPWCPATTSDGPAGIWFDGNAVYDIDGQFILDLAEIYDDPVWKLYDEDRNVLSTDTAAKFNELVTGGPQADAAAGPVNLCVYGEIEWAEGGGPIPATVHIPIIPVVSDTRTIVGTTLGVTLDGVLIESSAPIDLIVGNYTIGAFDPCGGHVNPQEGYHMHATTGCSDAAAEVADGETAQFGYALDGFAIHAPYDPGVEADAGLDECNGHETAELGYHYHASQVEENAVLTCFTGTTTQATGGPGGGGAAPPANG